MFTFKVLVFPILTFMDQTQNVLYCALQMTAENKLHEFVFIL
jgi:hypothetical protein